MGAVHTQRTIAWNLVPTTDFEATVRFFEELMGWEMEQQGVPVHDLQFQRYAMFRCPNGVVLEVQVDGLKNELSDGFSEVFEGV